MSRSSRRPQQLYTIVMWLLSIIFSVFLIGLGNLIIKDLPNMDKQTTIMQFVDTAELSRIETLISTKDDELSQTQRAIEDAEFKVQSAKEDYQNLKASLDNWLKTRTATESSSQNSEVIKRTREVETYKKRERAALRILEAASTTETRLQRTRQDLSTSRTTLFDQAEPIYEKALRTHNLRVFLLRLALTLPLLILSGWLLAKKRKSSYWPLYRGFVLFAFFAFFVELVPYLPSYGGYIRYSVGIIIVFIAGHFIIRGMRKYLARKKIEESRSEGERRQSIAYETALKKIAGKTCPGCDRSIVKHEGAHTDFCVHCGIQLIKKCGKCNTRNISFYRFCLSCGTPSGAKEKEK